MSIIRKQKRKVIVTGSIVSILFLIFTVLSFINIVTEVKYDECEGGYELVYYKQAFYDETDSLFQKPMKENR